MTKFNAKNERTKRRYLHYLKNAKGNGDAVVDGAMQAIHRFEFYTRFRDFDKFDTRQAIAFKDHLAKETNARTKEHLSQATLRSILAALKAFFCWLASQPGYRRLTYSDADYFNLSLHDEAIAKARREKSPPTIEQIRHVVNTMPSRTDIERRDRAVVAFIILTGLRDNAVASLRLGDVDLAKGKVRQDARHVRTKFAQTNEVWFFPIGDDFRAIVESWVTFLLVERHWGLDDPLFPATEVAQGADRVFETKGLKRKGWANAEPIRAIFRAAFAAAGLPYCNPHLFRKTLVLWLEKTCRTAEEFKCGSQNLGHKDVLTTFGSYGTVPTHRQAEVLRALGRTNAKDPKIVDLIQQLARETGAI